MQKERNPGEFQNYNMELRKDHMLLKFKRGNSFSEMKKIIRRFEQCMIYGKLKKC